MLRLKRVHRTNKRWHTGQQQGALLVALMNRLLTTDQPRVNRGSDACCFLPMKSIVRASEEMFKTVVFATLEGERDTYLLSEPTGRLPAWRSLALPP